MPDALRHLLTTPMRDDWRAFALLIGCVVVTCVAIVAIGPRRRL